LTGINRDASRIFVILPILMSPVPLYRPNPKLILHLALLLGCLCLLSCRDGESEQQAQFYVFGTVMDVTVRAGDNVDTAGAFADLQAAFQKMHRDWHAWEPGLLGDINEGFATGEPVQAGPGLVEMIRRSQGIEEKSGGRFNPAIGALVRLWGFHTSEYPIEGPPPGRSQIEDLVRRHPSSLDIQIEGLTLSTANPAVQLDFGGIAKGYAIDIACETLRERGIENAIVNAGGDLRVIGSHGDRPWRIAIRNPAGGVIGALDAGEDESIFTSGVYERFRQDDHRRYPHILDPRTGWPVEELASVTVITGEGLLADAAATALIVAGPDEWEEVAHALALDQVLLVDSAGRVYLTEKMRERVDFVEGVEFRVLRLSGTDQGN